jgi:sec-independent protein translocase protein TatA
MESGFLAEIFGPDGLVIIGALVIVLLFGGAKLPKLARSLGSASNEFKKGAEKGESEALPPPTVTVIVPEVTRVPDQLDR